MATLYAKKYNKTVEENQEMNAASCRARNRYQNVNRGRKRKDPPIAYRTLSELDEVIESTPHRNRNKKENMVNVYGAVLGIRPPQLTKKSEWMMQINLTDESLPIEVTKNTQGKTKATTTLTSVQGTESRTVVDEKRQIASVTLLIFCLRFEDLPQIFCAGDILRVHRVLPQRWNNEVQLLSRHMSSFTVCRPKATIFEQYLNQLSSALQLVPSDHESQWEVDDLKKSPLDFARAGQLWRWAQERLANHSTINEEFRNNISQITELGKSQTTHGDLTVMIAGIITIPRESRRQHLPRGFLRIWDGSGRPISDARPFTSAENSNLPEPPSEALSSIANIIGRMTSSNDAPTFDPPKMLCGKVINIAIWEDSYWNLITSAERFVKVGEFIRLRNVRRNYGRLHTQNREIYCLNIDCNVQLTPLPNYTYEIKSLLTEHNTRVVQNQSFNRNSGCLPLVLKKDLGRQRRLSWYKKKFPNDETSCTLLQCILGKSPCSFQVRFIIEKVIPSINEEGDGLRILCVRNNGKSGMGNQYVANFQFALRVRDETIEVDIAVSNSAAEQLLGITTANILAKMDGPHHTPQHQEAMRKFSRCIETSVVYKGAVQSLVLNGSKYFVLDSLIR